MFEYQRVVSSSFNSTLISNSYIEYNYTPLNIPYGYGEISLTIEGTRIGNTGNNTTAPPTQCMQGWYNFSPYVTVTDAKMTSYSSDYWTDRLLVNTINTGWNWGAIYNLSDFGYNYLILGDPYIVEIPANLITSGNNYVCIGTGFNVSNATGGSPDDRLIYTLRVKGSVQYGDVFNSSGLAIEDAIKRLFNLTGNYLNVTTGDIKVGSNSVSGVQYTWGPASVRVRVWS